MRMKNKPMLIGAFVCVTIALLLTSCVDGFLGDKAFTSDVKNSKLTSPDSIAFTLSADGSTLTVGWSPVMGAGGYKASLYNNDVPAVPVAVGQENEVVDGDTIQRLFDAESNYKAVVYTLGNTQNNNTGSDSARVGYYGVSTYATIPNGTDLYTYFQTNPVPTSTTTILYQLIPGGSYTMSGNITFGLTPVEFRGDKTLHPTLTMSNGVFIDDGAAVKFSRMDFNCSALPSSDALVTLDPTQNASALKWASSSTATTAPTIGVYTGAITFNSCKITGLAGYLVYDSGKPYVVQALTISDCIVQMVPTSASTSKSLISLATNGFVQTLTFTKSTFYHTVSGVSTNYVLAYANSMNVAKVMMVTSTTNASLNITQIWANQVENITNCTFYQTYQSHNFANTTGFAKTYTYLTLTKNIFYNSGNNRNVRDLLGGNTTAQPSASFSKNTYWWNGAASTSEVPTYDNSGTTLTTDPAFKDPSNGDFTVGGASQITNQTGDPRWL